MKMQEQNYDYFLVLDFEATCQEGPKLSKQEIIEFPVLKVDGKTFDVTDKFHEYVKPVHNPILTDFCCKLTGITQEMVESSKEFPEVFSKFMKWLEESVGRRKNFVFVTCGDWDLKHMLPEQCKRDEIILPPYFSSWINIKKSYANKTGVFVKGMMPMLKELKISHVGRHHSGIDDCRNVANILKILAKEGFAFLPTCKTSNWSLDFTPMSVSESDTPLSNLPVNLVPEAQPVSDMSVSVEVEKKTSRKSNKKQKSQSEVFECIPDNRNFRSLKNPKLGKMVDILVWNKGYFQGREAEEMSALCAAVKYFHLMERDDCDLFRKRLHFYYKSLPTELIYDAHNAIDTCDVECLEMAESGKENSIKKNKRSKKKSKNSAIHDDFVFV